MTTYKDLLSNLQYDQGQGSTINESVDLEKVKDEFKDATIKVWAKAIHTCWLATITLDELKSGLTQVETFTDDAVSTEANIYFLEVVVHVDTVSILGRKFPTSDKPIFVDQYIWLTSNHPRTTTGQDTNELDCEGLVPNESIEWTALSKNGTDTIQLKKFHASPCNPNADFSKIISTPVVEEDAPNKYMSYVKSDPEANFKKAYSFDFTINNGNQQFTFDPWLGDEPVHDEH